MASSVPALLTKITRFRPRVVCFIGKGIWLHVERALSLFKGDVAGNKNAGICNDPPQSLDAEVPGHVPEPAKTAVALNDGRSAYFHLIGDIADMERSPKAEPESLDFCGAVKLEESGSDVSSKQNTMNTKPVLSTLPHSTTRRGGISSSPRPASKKAKALPAPAFSYGLQPFRAVHTTMHHVRNFFYGLHENFYLTASLP